MQKKEKPQRQQTDEALFKQQVEAIMRQQIDQCRINVAALAAEMCMSMTAFRRRFNSLMGHSPQAHITAMKMQKARKLLDKKGEKTIADVGMAIGFDDKSNFTRAFRQAFGITPSDYIRERDKNAK